MTNKKTKKDIDNQVVITDEVVELELEELEGLEEPEELNEVKEIKKSRKAKEVEHKDLTDILKVLPDTFTTKLLDEAFNLNDGGKTVRRHLRKYFSEVMEHNTRDKWSFSKEQTEIIQHFADRYDFNPDAIK